MSRIFVKKVYFDVRGEGEIATRRIVSSWGGVKLTKIDWASLEMRVIEIGALEVDGM